MRKCRRRSIVNRAIEWFARNPVAANLLMVLILAAGFVTAFAVKKEVFPEFDLDQINITVLYLGASPAEVEEAVCVRIEEAIQGIDGIKQDHLDGVGRIGPGDGGARAGCQQEQSGR